MKVIKNKSSSFVLVLDKIIKKNEFVKFRISYWIRWRHIWFPKNLWKRTKSLLGRPFLWIQNFLSENWDWIKLFQIWGLFILHPKKSHALTLVFSTENLYELYLLSERRKYVRIQMYQLDWCCALKILDEIENWNFHEKLKVALTQKRLEDFFFSKINIPNHYPEREI